MVFSPTTVTGTAVLEYGPTEILPQVGALSKHTERLCRPGRQAIRAQPRGKPAFSTPRQQLGERDGLSAGGKWIRTVGPPPELLAQRSIGRSTVVFRRDREFDVSALQGRLSTCLANSVFDRPGSDRWNLASPTFPDAGPMVRIRFPYEMLGLTPPTGRVRSTAELARWRKRACPLQNCPLRA